VSEPATRPWVRTLGDVGDRVVNATPHQIVIYDTGAPDQIDPAGVYATAVLFPTQPPARLDAEHGPADPLLLADGWVSGPVEIPVRTVRYTSRVTGLPEPDGHSWYVVPLPVALASPDRTDLLVVDREVRSPAGTVIGCRGLARVSG
jgi:hypothetical protein